MSLRTNINQDAVPTLRMHDPVEVGSDGDVGAAIALMQARRSGCVIVTEEGRSIGILSERDILTRVLADNLPMTTPLSEVMTPNPCVLHEADTVASVIESMHAGGFRHMPVVDANGMLCGVVSAKRIVEYVVDHFPAAVFNLPPEPIQTQATREGA